MPDRRIVVTQLKPLILVYFIFASKTGSLIITIFIICFRLSGLKEASFLPTFGFSVADDYLNFTT